MGSNIGSKSHVLPTTPSSSPPPPGVAMDIPLVYRSFISPELELPYDEVFTSPPQRPHFSPLEIFKSEQIKEGVKLGLNIAFMNLVLKLRNLHDSAAFLSEEQSFVKEFKDFEDMGYDLTIVREMFSLLKSKAEEEKVLMDEIEKLEQEKEQKQVVIEDKEYLLMDIEKEIERLTVEIKEDRSEIDRIESKKKKIMDDLEMNEFTSLSSKPW